MIETAVILAAGLGSRLKEQGELYPKGFLQFGEKPIVEESIEKLLQFGIRQIIIVTGYRHEYYDRLAQNYSAIATFHNPHYAESGSLYSLYCAKDAIAQDFLLLESDLIYENKALESLIKFPQNNGILLSGETLAGDEVYVETNGKLIVSMSKNKNKLKQITGEFVGISKISFSLFESLLKEADRQFKTTLKRDYETDGLVAVAQTYPIYYKLVENLIWAEIDDAHHLNRAKQTIYPALQ